MTDSTTVEFVAKCMIVRYDSLHESSTRSEVIGGISMDRCHELIREYCVLLEQEQRIRDRKEQLKEALLAELTARSVQSLRTASGNAVLTKRYRLTPRTEAVLALLSCEDVLPFAQFTPAKVRNLLVPRYGREPLIPLFEIEASESLTIHRVGRTSNHSLPAVDEDG